MKTILHLAAILLVFPYDTFGKSKYKKKKKPKVTYQYVPDDYEAPTVVCTKPSKPSGGGGSSVWGYMTAAVVATTVAANIVNNANENNNNNNNNNNEDNKNNNNQNVNSDMNSNMNVNMVAPGRSLASSIFDDSGKLLTFATLFIASLLSGEREKDTNFTLTSFFKRIVCNSFQDSVEIEGLDSVIRRVLSLTFGFLLSDHFKDSISFEDILDIFSNKDKC